MRAAFFLLLAVALPAAAQSRPKLIVLIVAEQFRADYLDRYRASFSAGGFNRLLKGGAVFRQCRYEYAATFPASGAAVIATGSYPERNGIVAEHWYDRRARRVVGAVEDREAAVVGSDQPRRPAGSPKNLVGTTLADELRLATGGRSRAVSISLRDQTAVLLGGRRPAGCYWLDEAGRFVTSSYYTATLPEWVSAFQQGRPALRFRGRPWRAVDAKDGAPPLRVLEGQGAGGLQDFFSLYRASPLAVDEQLDFAREAVEKEELGGKGAAGDLLVLSISSLYYLGLEVGADSPLMRDLVLRLDRKLEELFSWLDGRLGADNVWIAFTATQGLPELPEALREEGISAGRVAGDQIAAAVNARLSAVFGRAGYVEKYVFPSLYLRRETLQDGRAADMLRVAGEAALGVSGVGGYLAPGRGIGGLGPEVEALLARCIFPERSGDILLTYQPYYSEWFGEGRGVAPGSSYNYDTRVPLVLHGGAFRAETFESMVSPADLAATLAAALGIPPPAAATGRVLIQALKER